MDKIFLGLLFVLLDVNINIGASSIEILPDFVGYILLIKGLAEVMEYSEEFKDAQNLSKGMVFYSAIVFVLDIIAVLKHPVFTIILALISTAGSLVAARSIIKGMQRIEICQMKNLMTDVLMKYWQYLALFSVAGVILSFVGLLGAILVLVALIFAIIFLVKFSNSRNLYYGREKNKQN